MVACVEFPDLLGQSGAEQKIGQHRGTESWSPRAPPEKRRDELKLLLECAQFLRTYESYPDLIKIRKFNHPINFSLTVCSAQLIRGSDQRISEKNAGLGTLLFFLLTEFMVLPPALHPNCHPIKRFDLIPTDTCYCHVVILLILCSTLIWIGVAFIKLI